MKLAIFGVFIIVALVLPTIQAAKSKKGLNKFTESSTGCPCWWDLTRGNKCACCTDKGVQCGFPKHRSCQNKKNKKGCPGIPKARYTLSTKGYSCFFDPERRNDCAWCAFGGYQCGPGMKAGPESSRGNHCFNGKNTKYCDSVLGDCRHISNACDPNASCKMDRKFANTWLYKCECNKGFTGNGVQCFDKEGNLSPNPNEQVEMNIDLKSEFYVFPHEEGQYNDADSISDLKGAMEKVSDKICNKKDCSASYTP